MQPDPSGRRLREGEGEGVEHPRGAEPDVPVAAEPQLGAQLVAVALAQAAVHAVRGDDDVGPRERVLRRAAVAAEPHVDAEVDGAVGEDLQQPGPSDAEAVPPEVGHAAAGQPDLLALPQVRRRSQRARADAVVAVQGVEQVVPEHHAPPVRGAAGVALQDGDVEGGCAQLGQEGGVETGRATADADDLHGITLRQMSSAPSLGVRGRRPLPRSATRARSIADRPRCERRARS